jgi:glutathione S-transferase
MLRRFQTGFEPQMDYIHVELGEEKPTWYQAEVNPFGTVPCLYVDGKPVFESLLVADYINDVTNGKLYPADPVQKANVKLVVGQFGEKCVPHFYKVCPGPRGFLAPAL